MSTSYSVDGGAVESGTSVTLASEGDHAISFFSTDAAGNVEAAQTAHVKIDKTAPSIGHSFTPLTYSDGAWSNQDVTVTFECADTGSGVASCTAPVTTSSEGLSQQVTGTATDNAGNSASDTAVVSIDKTAPTISASADRAANTAGWYRDDVTVSFSANDALSGLASTSPAQVVGEGANQSSTGTATDAAGNSASADVSGINVDKTAPVLTAEFSPGWHTDDVTVVWTCTDALSGVAAGPVDDTVTGEGGNLSSSASCTDVAGNTANTSVDGIQIDRTAPTTTATVPDPLASGWYADEVLVTLTGHDTLSGIAATHYSIDGGAAQLYAGAFSFSQKGTHTIAFWSTDAAGNSEDTTVNSITLKIDDAPPVTTVINPISPASGWFVTSGIPVAFDADDAESGIAATYYEIDGGEAQTYGDPFTAELATGSHTITYWSVDLAGNTEAKQTTIVNVDDVAPSIVGVASPAANGFGWNNTDVDVAFTCTDAESGVAGCGPDGTVSTEGENQQVQGDTQDVAGNVNSTTVDHINIDKTAPTLVGVATSDANGAGWYNGDVTIEWTGNDALSGIDPSTQPADSTIGGEGIDLGASASIFDKAGNKKTASASGINIDRTAPHIEGAPTTAPNAAGWYRDQVVLDFTCTDALSGVASCPTSEVIAGDGADQAVTSDPASDKAGNLSDGKTVGGINIDGSAPSTTANNQCTKTNGWCTGPSANVVLTATDQAGLSGVKEIHYRIDGGAEQVAAGAAKTVSVPLDGSGAGTVHYWAVDIAGNTEASNAVALKWDNIAPMVTHTLSPVPNANDWNNSDVTVTFGAKDDDAGSGVADVTAPVTVTTETDGQVLVGSATDTAGNVGTDSVTVKLDKTAPTISGAVVSGTQGANGWYVGPVTVHFTCADDRSGVATCPDDVILTSNGANSASGTVTDKAGNTAVTAVSGINIDTEAPTITAVNVAGGLYVLGAVPGATCAASDGFSGLAGSCVVTISGGTANGVGAFTYTARATDAAGNTGTTTGSYRVIYRFDGFLQPINDTAHQVGTSTSVFKGASTIPVKFQLKNASGTLVQANAAPVWLTPAKGASMSLPVDESLYAATADSGSTYRVEGSQYGYNWKTPSGGHYHRIGVTLDDGQTYYVNIGLR
ncbi:OmpL47-type beta-barrel domain-containing protein [Agromyces albus]|uniref:OmpL47-type beta-barrel domain-containing protein n=1 Tax=Agromyces albus TaxID=205332 RepID=UPI0013E94251|nr:PxKF domain-containing protein [Agromyces albus]